MEELKTRLPGTFENFMMLNALVTAVDNKDRYTRRHSDDVLTYSVQIAEGLGLDDETLFTVRIAALLHDVGKIGVPDSILRKPGKLTEEEFAAIKQHPSMGAIIVSSVPGFEATLDAVRYHHERWDGKGYPSGLAGEDIPLIGRLMAVADAYSAMTTDRPYRKAMASSRAEEILRGGAGSQWDPACVEAFFKARESGGLT
jgi:HD-GYP domain-containing protein (c-di-GMP phosphodiesterase class II)